MKEFSVVLALIGMVIGSGFISGKEVVVFFSRFGGWSFLSIPLCFVLFFFLFKLILNSDFSSLNRSNIVFFSNQLLCIIFSSSMFGAINNLLDFNQIIIKILLFLLIFAICLLIFFKGGRFFNKINLFLVPIMIIIFLCCLFSKTQDFSFENVSFGSLSLFYACLYVLLNTSNGAVMISTLAKGLSSKQKTRVAFVCSLVLCLILLFANCVLLSHPQSFQEEMPLLSIFSGAGLVLMKIVVLLGCLTTLFSLVYCLSSSFREKFKDERLNMFQAIVLPALVSLLGFGTIVAYLYPLASILGGVLIISLFYRKGEG